MAKYTGSGRGWNCLQLGQMSSRRNRDTNPVTSLPTPNHGLLEDTKGQKRSRDHSTSRVEHVQKGIDKLLTRWSGRLGMCHI